MNPIIDIAAVTRRFGRFTALSGVSLRLEPGESVALWGPNGAGKTTLLRCVLGLLRFEGRVTIHGLDVSRQGKAARMLIGYVPQEIGFYDDLRVAEAVQFFAQLKGLSDVVTASTLNHVGLCGHERKRIRELSGGMKQRLALAIALLGDPPVLVLDEVTASLDAVGREEFVGLLRGLSGSGRTMLFASHRVEEVATLAQRVVRLESSRISQIQTREQFLASLGAGSVLHLVIAPEAREPALRSLQAEGFAPALNGVGVLVPVAPEHKAAPFRVLAQARIRVDDFSIVTAGQAAALASHAQELRT